VENAIKAALITYQYRSRNGSEPSSESITSCMENQAPGSPNLSVISFYGGFHGRTLGSLSCTRTKSIHKIDIPAFDFPATPFPKLKYPLAGNEKENRQEEDRCLTALEATIETWKTKSPVAALLVEPIQGEGGDNHASAYFFQQVREISEKHGILMIVDEVQTGGGNCGRYWEHESWNLKSPPDFVTFSKKMLTGGYFSAPGHGPKKGYQIFNTWMGDPHKLVQLEAVHEVIRKENLLERVAETGDYIHQGLLGLEQKFPKMMRNSRGKGTFRAFDTSDPRHQVILIEKLRSKGILIAGSGTLTIRIRPTLTLTTQHAKIFLDALEICLFEMSS